MKTFSLLSISALAAFILLLILILSQLVAPTRESQTGFHQPSKPQVYQLRFGHNTPEDSALHLAAVKFAEEVAIKTQGRVEVKVYPAQVLGNDHQMVEMARNGELDILLTPTAKMSVAVPSMQYADLPFLFPSREDAYALLDGQPGQLLLEDLKSINLVGVAFWENGFKHFTANRPLNRPEDFVGKRFRVMKSRIISQQFDALGSEVVPIDFHTTRQALKDGVVDGQENPLVAIVSMGFHEVQSHLTFSEHAYLGYVFSISQKTLEKLPQDLGQILIQTANAITPWEREETQRREDALLKEIIEAGVEVYRLSPQEKQAFAQKTDHIIRQFEPVIGANIISKTQFYLRNKYDLKDQNKIVIGLSADLSTGGKAGGLAIKRGLEMAIDQLNRSGGVLGREIVLLPMDHRSIATKGIENVKILAERNDVMAIFGGLHSAVVLEELNSIQALKVPYLNPWATVAQVTENGYEDNYAFRLSINDRFASQFLVDFVLKRHQTPAVVVENSVWGRNNLALIREHLDRLGLKATVEIVFNRGQKDFSVELEKLALTGTDSVILVANSVEATTLTKALVDSQADLALVSHWGVVGGSFFEDIEPFQKHLDLSVLQTFSFDNPRPEIQRFYRQYQQNYQPSGEVYAANGIAQAYDLMHLLALAIEQAGQPNRTLVKQALENLPPYQGLIKTYAPAFSVTNHDALNEKDVYMAKLTPNGQLVKIEP
ncbi:DctP family TRAP transporter solute-binding subunit [Thiomicrospira sp.]|uniref:DctP family TRAP transporter solute-binding subunit n=1 Tax=Thiomicrospira sp. TaxID=935 RepID=UPI002F92B327